MGRPVTVTHRDRTVTAMVSNMVMSHEQCEFDPYSGRLLRRPVRHSTGGCATRRPCTATTTTGSARCRATTTSSPRTGTGRRSPAPTASRSTCSRIPNAQGHGATGSIIFMDPPEHDRSARLGESGVHAQGRRRSRADDPRTRLPATSTGSTATELRSRRRLLRAVPGRGDLGDPRRARADRQQIRHWTDTMLHREPGNPKPTQEGMEAMLHQVGYLYELAAEKRRHPTDDMFSRLIETGLTDDGGRRLRRPARRGRERDRHQAHRQRRGALRPEPGRVGEGLRRPRSARARGRGDPAVLGAVAVPGPLQHRRDRVARRDDPGGRAGAADHRRREPRRARLSGSRSLRRDRPLKLNVGFGHGIHTCLGAALARLESRIAFDEIATRWPRLRGRRSRAVAAST